MKKNKSRQIRISEPNYDILGKLSEKFGIGKQELLGNAVALLNLILDAKATSIKIVSNDAEREYFLSLLTGGQRED